MVRVLCNRFGFTVVRSRGSHVVLRKESADGPIGTVVPQHRELAAGTLADILAQAQVSRASFEQEL